MPVLKVSNGKEWVTGVGVTLNPTTFADNTFKLVDDGDAPKRMQFQLSGLTTGLTRTLTVQDKSYTIADAADVPALPVSLVNGGTGSDLPGMGAGNFITKNSTGATLEDAGVSLGTSGTKIPLLDGANTWSTDQIFQGNIVIGSGAAGVDNTLTFDGETNDGLLTWKEDEDYFEFNDDLFMVGAERISFRATGNFIVSGGTGELNLEAVTKFKNLISGVTKWQIDTDDAVFSTNVEVDGTHECKGFFDTYVGYTNAISADAFAIDGNGVSMSATRGWVAPYDGSIVSIGCSVTVVGSFLSQWRAYTRIGGVNALFAAIDAGSSGDKNVNATAARGTHTFSAGDVISFFFDEISGSASLTTALVHCRVQYDS